MKKTVLTCMIICLTLSSLMGCARAFRPQVGPSWSQDLLNETPPGPDNFRIGWKDGCETGISATSNHWQKFFYKFKQNYRLAQDNEYYTGWKTGYTYCQRYVFQYLKRDIL